MKNIIFVFSFIALFTSNDLMAQEITMFPGFWGPKYYQDDTQISLSEVGTLMTENAEANALWKKSKRHMTYAWVALGAEVGFLVWQLNRASNNDSQTVPLIGVLGTAAVGLGFSLSAANIRRDAILKYNNGLDMSKLDLGLTQNGVGLVYSF